MPRQMKFHANKEKYVLSDRFLCFDVHVFRQKRGEVVTILKLSIPGPSLKYLGTAITVIRRLIYFRSDKSQVGVQETILITG
jgi:hypothetical protein